MTAGIQQRTKRSDRRGIGNRSLARHIVNLSGRVYLSQHLAATSPAPLVKMGSSVPDAVTMTR